MIINVGDKILANKGRIGEIINIGIATEKSDIAAENDNKIGYWRKLEDGANGDNLYEVYFDDREDEGDYLQSQEFVSDEDNAEETAYDYARSI